LKFSTSCFNVYMTTAGEIHSLACIPETERICFNGQIMPNVLVECLTRLLRARKVTFSNLGTETSYPNWVFFVVFSSPVP
jgi:hypothetical protein